MDVIVGQPAKEIRQTPVAFEPVTHDKGSPLGLAGALMPNTVWRIVVCANLLKNYGLTFAQMSELVVAPLGEANLK